MAGPLSALILGRLFGALPDARQAVTSLELILHDGERRELRQEIRRRISAQEGLRDDERGSLMDLAHVPRRVGGRWVSISHSQDLGIWISATTPCGVDLDDSSRVTTATVRRVCSSNEEVLGAPLPAALLWCAKEASFKAANDDAADRPTLLSQIEIHGWIGESLEAATSWSYHWRSKTSTHLGRGAATIQDGRCFALSLLSTQLWS